MQLYEKMYEVYLPFMTKIWTLRAWIGFVAESFIVTDRYLFLI